MLTGKLKSIVPTEYLALQYLHRKNWGVRESLRRRKESESKETTFSRRAG